MEPEEEQGFIVGDGEITVGDGDTKGVVETTDGLVVGLTVGEADGEGDGATVAQGG